MQFHAVGIVFASYYCPLSKQSDWLFRASLFDFAFVLAGL